MKLTINDMVHILEALHDLKSEKEKLAAKEEYVALANHLQTEIAEIDSLCKNLGAMRPRGKEYFWLHIAGEK